MPERLNGCEYAIARDRRGDSEVEIVFGGRQGERYFPACVRVRLGSVVRFSGRFDAHPLEPGPVVDGIPSDPVHDVIQPVEEGREVEIRMSELGAHGFYCDAHVHSDMMGAIFVE